MLPDINIGSSTGTSTSTFHMDPGATSAYNQMLQAQQQGYAALSQNVLGGYASMYNQGMKDVANYGQTAALKTQQSYNQQQASALQGLASRGLGNSTVLQSVQSGIQQRANEDLNVMLPEQVSQYHLQAMSQLGGQLYGAASQLGQAGLGAQARLGEAYLSLLGRSGTTTTSSQQQHMNINPYGRGGGGYGGGGGGGGGWKFNDPSAGGFQDPGPGYNPSQTIPLPYAMGGPGNTAPGDYSVYGGFSGAGDTSYSGDVSNGGGDF